MRKIILSLAALAVIGVAIPYAAPAKADPILVVRHHDRNWHPRHHDNVVIIKHHDQDHR
jgi:hypothetical protein